MDVLPQLSLKAKDGDVPSLDIKDRKILFLLSLDARTPLTQIAKRVNLSRDAVKYRVDGYQKAGVLNGTVTVVDVAKLGYHAYHIFVRLNSLSKEAERSLINDICTMPCVRAVLRFFGSYDLEIAVIAKNLGQFDQILTDIASKFGRFIRDYEIMIIAKTYASGAFPKNFFNRLRQEETVFGVKKAKKQEYLPDKKDMEIVKSIRDDARLPLTDISRAVDLSTDAVSYRIKRLMDNVIISFNPVINYKKIGYTVHALLFNISPLDKESEKRLHTFLSNDEGILWAVKTIGRFNVLAYTCTRSETELQDMVNRLREEFPEEIKRQESLLAFEEYKYTYAPDCLFD